MKRKVINIFLIIGLCCFGNKLAGQSENKIACIALVREDSVVLRWTPASVPVFQIGVKYGYIIKRYIIAKGGIYIPDGLSKETLLTSAPIKPVLNELFDTLSLTEPRVSVVQEAIYGTDFQLPEEGQDFSVFIKEYNDLEVRFGFAMFMCDLSPVIARAAGLEFTDKNILPDERYAYSVSLADIPDEIEVDPAVVVLDAGIITTLPKVIDVQAIFMDKSVKFQWPIIMLKGTYTAYIIEKSIDGIHFTSVSDLPVVNLSENDDISYFTYTDSLSNNYEQTWYRVKGISPFGEEGPSSDIIKGKGIPEFTAYSVIDSAEVSGNKSITIRWRVTESETAPITGISILRSDKYDGVFENLTQRPLEPGARMFSDKNPMLSNYYKIMLSGKSNLTSFSFPYLVQTEDNEPPETPIMLSGKVDSAGIVTIFWKENTEPDLRGYKVFRANATHEDFIEISRDISTLSLFHDTININTLTQKIYYAVVATDNHFNNSDYSSILELSRPDTIRPAPAVISHIDVKNGIVIIQQESSPSNDIGFYELQRNAETDTIALILKTWRNELPVSFEEVPPEQGTNYSYTIKTYDLAGNSSQFSRGVYVPEFSQTSINLNVRQDKNGKTIKLEWTIPEGCQPVKTIIYRSKAGESLSIYKTLETPDQLFEDKNIELNTSYNYRIRVFSTNGNSNISSPLVAFNPLVSSLSEIK